MLLGGRTKFMSISRLASSIKESPTLSLNEEARRLRSQGQPVIHLGIGEPKKGDHSLYGGKLREASSPRKCHCIYWSETSPI